MTRTAPSRPRTWTRAASLACASAIWLGCEDPELPLDPPSKPTLGAYEVVVAAQSTFAGVTTQTANNNLDVVRFQDRTFLAWRTAPTHFASPETRLYVASEGPDGWRFEGELFLMTDLREPRFLVLGDRLFLYFAVLGTDGTKFEPQGMKVTEYQGPGTWTAPEDSYEPTFIPWRAKVIGGTAYLIGYVGGGAIYDESTNPIRVHFLTTTDGRTFSPVTPGEAVVQEGGGSETDFEILDDGSLVAVTRNEAGDAEFGFGSKICRAEAGALSAWTCKADKRKYDSPLVFRQGADVWLVGRRNLTESGNYDLDRDDLSLTDQRGTYEIDYSFNPKRCSLWRVDPVGLEVTFELDLPSRGDTCFASRVDHGGGVVSIYNYSSELDGAPDCARWPDDCADPSWFVAQSQNTIIYRVDATFP